MHDRRQGLQALLCLCKRIESAVEYRQQGAVIVPQGVDIDLVQQRRRYLFLEQTLQLTLYRSPGLQYLDTKCRSLFRRQQFRSARR